MPSALNDLEQRRGALPSTHAHRHDDVLDASPAPFDQSVADQASAAYSIGMSNGNRSAVDIEPVGRDAELVGAMKFFMQRMNLVNQHVNLKYGLGLELNNYRYNIGTNISYLEHNPYVTGQVTSPVVIRDSIQFTKNKLAADYLTVPLMLNFSSSPGFTNRGISLSVGVSAGYLYSQRNKQVSHERGKEKNKGDYDLERFKLSYVAELGLGPVRFYGSYSPKSFYGSGLDMKPYTLGIRFSNW